MFFDSVADLLMRQHDPRPRVVPPTALVAVAVRLMNRHDTAVVLVINGGRLEGILTERDIVQRVVSPGRDPAATSVREIMTRAPRTIAANAHVAAALECMNRTGFRHLPVEDGDSVVGVLSLADLNRWLGGELQEQARGLPPVRRVPHLIDQIA